MKYNSAIIDSKASNLRTSARERANPTSLTTHTCMISMQAHAAVVSRSHSLSGGRCRRHTLPALHSADAQLTLAHTHPLLLSHIHLRTVYIYIYIYIRNKHTCVYRHTSAARSQNNVTRTDRGWSYEMKWSEWRGRPVETILWCSRGYMLPTSVLCTTYASRAALRTAIHMPWRGCTRTGHTYI